MRLKAVCEPTLPVFRSRNSHACIPHGERPIFRKYLPIWCRVCLSCCDYLCINTRLNISISLLVVGSYVVIQYSFEMIDPTHIRDWMVANNWFPITVCLVYALGIVLGQAYFKNREPWNWRRTMATWDLALSLFSLCGFVRVFPPMVHQIVHYSAQENFCMDPESLYGSSSTGFWVQLFIVSKVP
jgi:GNS1/SUR4 family